MSRNMTAAALSVTAAVAPNKVGSGVVLMNPADQPASLFPSALERKNTPIMSPTTCLGASLLTTDRQVVGLMMGVTTCLGASLLTTDRPTELRHSSPSSSMKYTATSHSGLIL